MEDKGSNLILRPLTMDNDETADKVERTIIQKAGVMVRGEGTGGVVGNAEITKLRAYYQAYTELIMCIYVENVERTERCLFLF